MDYHHPLLKLLLVSLYLASMGQETNCIDAEEEILIKELKNWEAPYFMQRNYPYVLSGLDHDGCPVWLVEYGRWDVRAIMENGTETIDQFGKYILQALYNIYFSSDNYSVVNEESLCQEFQIVADLDGYDARQFTHVPALTRTLNIFRDYVLIESKHGRRLKGAVGVNLNFLATSLWNLVRHIIGDLANRVQIFGTMEEKWKPTLRKEFPRDALPAWLGGSENHTAIKVYG